MPQGTRGALRRQVARMRRGRAHRQSYHVPGIGNVIEGRKLLEATDGTGYFSASYQKVMGKGWVFKESDPALEFLRYCGQPQDAKRAMKKRGLVWRWR